MAMWGGRLRDPEGGRANRFQQPNQRARPMDPYRAGGPQGYMARVQRMNPGAAQAQTSGKANRQTVQAGAGGQQGGALSRMGGQPGQGGVMSKLMQGVQGQPGQGGRSGKPNRQTVAAGQQPGQGDGRMYAGGSPGWAQGGGQGVMAGGPDPSGRGSGKPNRRTVPGNAGGGMIGRGGLRGRRRNQPKRQANVLGTAAGRKKAAQAMGTKGGLLNKSPVKTMQRGAFEGVAR
jgi:hypothetical protein